MGAHLEITVGVGKTEWLNIDYDPKKDAFSIINGGCRPESIIQDIGAHYKWIMGKQDQPTSGRVRCLQVARKCRYNNTEAVLKFYSNPAQNDLGLVICSGGTVLRYCTINEIRRPLIKPFLAFCRNVLSN